MSSGALPQRTLWLYALPNVGLTATHWLVMMFLLKFSTDVLGVAPAMIGGLFALGRVWDAVSDPIAGWASDRTQSRHGRRLSWMAAAAVPAGLAFYALWNPPVGVSPQWTTLWLGACIILFYTTQTALRIPYLSLGAELSPDHHERTRISAARVSTEVLGIGVAMAGLQWIETSASISDAASAVAAWIACGLALSLALSCARLREPLENQGRGAADPLRAFRDLLQNPHALRLTAVLMLAELGLGSLVVAMPFAAELFHGGGKTTPVLMLGFIVPFALSVPLWIRWGRRFGKARCLTTASGMSAAAFFVLGATGAWMDPDSRMFSGFMTVSLLAIGISQGALRTFPDSIKADVIDWDEARTGERKEGTYFAAWNLADKLAGAISVGVVGLAIQAADGGVDPDGLRLVFGYLPGSFLLLSMLAMRRFKIDATAHAALRARIDSAQSRTTIQRAKGSLYRPAWFTTRPSRHRTAQHDKRLA